MKSLSFFGSWEGAQDQGESIETKHWHCIAKHGHGVASCLSVACCSDTHDLENIGACVSLFPIATSVLVHVMDSMVYIFVVNGMSLKG